MLTTTWLPRAYKVLLLGVAFFMIAAIPAAACPPDKAELTVYKEIVFNPNHQDPVVGDFGISTSAGALRWELVKEDLTSRPAVRTYKSNMLTVDPGSYTLSEAAPSGTVSSVTCDKATVIDGMVDLPKGEHTKCTFVNRYSAEIEIGKSAPSAGDQLFDIEWTAVFDSGSALSRVVQLADGGAWASGFAPGDFTLDEINIPDGWDLTGVRCTGIEDPIVGSDADVAFHLEYGDRVSCSFVNEPLDLPTITVKKLTPGVEVTEQQFEFDLDYLGDGDFVEFSLGAGGERTMTVRPGSYSLNELVPDGWALTGAACKGGEPVRLVGGDDHAVVTVGYGDDVVCTFTNQPLPTVTVEKAANAAGSFEFTLATEGRSNTQVVTTGGSHTWTVVPDVYSLVEELPLPAYWGLVDVACTGYEEGRVDESGASFSVGYGDKVTCTFTNRYDPPTPLTTTLSLVKVVEGGDAAASSWNLVATGPQTVEGGGGFPAVAVTPGVYTLTETGSVDDYVNGTTWSCTGGNLVDDKVTVPYGGSVVCSIENTFSPPPTAVESEVLELEILPETGANSADVALIASSLVVAGGALLLLARREEMTE